MGKVYLKTKYDNEMKMEIPHNHNFASAMFGFREMAAEIVPYHLIDDMRNLSYQNMIIRRL